MVKQVRVLGRAKTWLTKFEWECEPRSTTVASKTKKKVKRNRKK